MNAPLQDCIYRKLEKQGKQDGKFDQPRPTMAQWRLDDRNINKYNVTNFAPHIEIGEFS